MSCFIKRFALKIVQKKVFVGYVYAETNTKTAIYITRQIQIVCHFWNENNYMVGITLHFVQLILTCSVLYVRCITWRVYSLRYHPMTASSPIPRGQTLNLLTLRMRWEDIRRRITYITLMTSPKRASTITLIYRQVSVVLEHDNTGRRHIHPAAPLVNTTYTV